MLDVDIRDNHLCLGVRINEVPDGHLFGTMKESVVIEPVKYKNGKITLKIVTIRYEGNAGYRGPDFEVTFDFEKGWTSESHGKRHKTKKLTKGMKEYNKYRKL